jgi:hypothetical protein
MINNNYNYKGGYIPTDWTLDTAAERIDKVNEIISNTPENKLTPYYLEKLGTYILEAETSTVKERKEQYPILTKNRMSTVNDWETSYEGLVGKLENGEDGLYNMMGGNDKNILRSPKQPFTDKEIAEIPGLAQLREQIRIIEEAKNNATGKKRSSLMKSLIAMRQDQYELRKAYKQPSYSRHLIKSLARIDLSEHIYTDEAGDVHSTGLINLFDEDHVSCLLCNYSLLKEESWDNFNGDMKWMLMDLEDLVERTLKDKYPMYFDLLVMKIDGVQNVDIQKELKDKYGILHSVEYISSLWRNKIPRLLVKQAEEDWLIWHYTQEEQGTWKKCSRCGQVKLAHNHFFSKNSASKDGWYSICKECRNKKN